MKVRLADIIVSMNELRKENEKLRAIVIELTEQLSSELHMREYKIEIDDVPENLNTTVVQLTKTVDNPLI
ncbi:unnamed protein product [Arctia plantaginis]|uniref:Uncharacterized protein n=1 Tax=Arctia plantaginis TaxID=874455 RepID=A0A8S1AFR4_ARCPL|nr:unnamed protein product [Arctia plantaginis]